MAESQVIYGSRPVEEAERGRRVCAGSGVRRRPLPRSWSGSADPPTTRASSPRSIRIPTPTECAAARARARCSSRSTRSRTRATSAPSAARPSSPAPPGVVIPERRSAEVTAVTCKASAGAVEHLDIARVRNLADWLAEAKDAGFWIWGADAEASQAPWDIDLTGPTDPRPRRRGQRNPPPRSVSLRRPRRPAEARRGRLAQRLSSSRRAAFRGCPPALLRRGSDGDALRP